MTAIYYSSSRLANNNIRQLHRTRIGWWGGGRRRGQKYRPTYRFVIDRPNIENKHARRPLIQLLSPLKI